MITNPLNKNKFNLDFLWQKCSQADIATVDSYSEQQMIIYEKFLPADTASAYSAIE